MSLGVCIPDLIDRGEIPVEKAARLRAFYDERVADYMRDMSRPAAEAQATDDALKWLSAETLQKARQRGLQHSAQARWVKRMAMEAGENGVLPVRAAIAQMARIDKQADALRGRYFASLDALLARHRRNLLGEVRHKAELEDIGRALFGEDAANPNVRELADAIAETMELARQRFNRAGGRIGKREDFGLPQSHDSRLVRQASFEEWRDFGPMARVSVLDLETGEAATGLRRETILRAVYETIRSEGANKIEPGATFAGGSIANRRGDPRVLNFANFDDWIEYQQRFGKHETIYDIIGAHLNGMARDTALMEAMGPNPSATLRFMQDSVEKNHKLRGSQRDVEKVEGSKARLARLFGQLTGANSVAEDVKLARIGSAVRSQQVAAKLGSAMLSAVPDFATMLHAANFNGLPMMRTLNEYLRLWNPLNGDDRRWAVRLGLVTDDWIGLSSSANRYLGEELQGEIARRLADGVIRAQGLSRHTRNGQWATGMNWIATLSHLRDRAFGNLDPSLQAAMRRYDIGEAEWDAFRKTKGREHRGLEWIAPADVADERAGDRFLEMILSETDYAVVVPDIRTQTFMSSWMKPGTVLGETLRSGFLFKGFPMAIISLHGRRMMEQAGLRGKAGYAVPLMLSMGALGALSAQLKTIAAGKDPQPMDNPRFVGRAMVQSGGLGLFGDLLFNSENSYGGGLAGTLLGPLLGQTIPNLADATVGNTLRAAGVGEGDPEFAKDLWRAAEAELPGRNLWYTRLAWERLIADQVTALADPDAAAGFRREARRAENEGTQFFWQPGAPYPGRAPDLANAVEGELPE